MSYNVAAPSYHGIPTQTRSRCCDICTSMLPVSGAEQLQASGAINERPISWTRGSGKDGRGKVSHGTIRANTVIEAGESGRLRRVKSSIAANYEMSLC